MKRIFLMMLVFSSFVYINAWAQDASYIGGMLSNINKSKGSEAVQSLSGYKDNLLGCLAQHVGNESACANMSFQSSGDFDYGFDVKPQDGSKQWSIKATPAAQSNLSAGDVVVLQSDDSGNVSCAGKGTLVGVC